MPLIKIKKRKKYTYGIWKIEESQDFLLKALEPNKQELIEIKKLTHFKRKKQNISARLILNNLSNKKVQLSYSKNGVPKCKPFNYISISHSNEYCIVIVSDNPIGIDIQYQKQNIKELSKKFINDNEIHMNSVLELNLIWCAKEAIYKTINNPECSFKENIQIDSIKNNMHTIGYYKNKKTIIKYQILYEKIKNYCIAIANRTL